MNEYAYFAKVYACIAYWMIAFDLRLLWVNLCMFQTRVRSW